MAEEIIQVVVQDSEVTQVTVVEEFIDVSDAGSESIEITVADGPLNPQIFTGPTPPAAANIGDIWIQI